MLEEAISGLEAVCNASIMVTALFLTVCLDKAAKNGTRLAPRTSSFRQLMDALVVALPLPERPTTLADAFSRIEAALCAVRLPQEIPHLCCIDQLRKISPTDPAPATGGMMDKARARVDYACKLLNFTIDQVDLAVAVISGFRHPKEVASNARFAKRYTELGWSGED
ncbi:hypothetical protein ZWY2020_052777 [Hordeum vulgare]|nr:hypothetical protein ZWY2020_052777 [Hordeum vulgare]